MQIDFEFETEYGTFKDSLYFADNKIPSESELTSLKQQRLDRWLQLVTYKPIFKLDENGNPVLDESGNPIILE